MNQYWLATPPAPVRNGSLSLGERYVKAAQLWILASIQFPSREVQVYVRRSLDQQHIELLVPKLTLETLEQILVDNERAFETKTMGDITPEVRVVLRELRERADKPA